MMLPFVDLTERADGHPLVSACYAEQLAWAQFPRTSTESRDSGITKRP